MPAEMERTSDSYMWFPPHPDAPGLVIAGESPDEWFGNVKGFQIYSFSLAAACSDESETATALTDDSEPFPTEPQAEGGSRRSAPAPPPPPPPLSLFRRATPRLSSDKAKFDELTITRDVDLASVELYRACTEEKEIPVAVIASRIATGTPVMYLQYVFGRLKIVEIEWKSAGTAGSDRPDEIVKFEYLTLATQYIQVAQDGTPSARRPWWVWSDTGRTPTETSIQTQNYFVRPTETVQAWKSRQR